MNSVAFDLADSFEESAGPQKGSDCHNILIVEDDEAIRSTLKFALELEGYKVFTAANGQEGVDLFKAMPKPCVVLLDLMMPVMNGWEFAEAVERDPELAAVPIVLVTAFADQAKTIRAKGIVKKPVDWNELVKIVRLWCPAL